MNEIIMHNDNIAKLNALMHACKSNNNKHFRYQLGVHNRFDKLRAGIQGAFLRDYNYYKYGKSFKLHDIRPVIIDLYLKMGLNFAYLSIPIYPDADKNMSQSTLKSFRETIQSYYHNENRDFYAFVYVAFPTHLDIHIVHRSANKISKVYIYESHKNYGCAAQFKKLYEEMGYNVMAMPNNVPELIRSPLYYMYIMHFFLGIMLYPTDYNYDDNSVVIFTRFILKFAYNYGLVGDKITYYLLTDNTDHIIRLTDNNKLTRQHLYYISSTNMLDILFLRGVVFSDATPSAKLMASYSLIHASLHNKRNKIILYALEYMKRNNKLDKALVIDLSNDWKYKN